MSTNEQIHSAAVRCAFLLRLVEEARLSPESKRANALYGMAKAESDTLVRSLESLLGRARPSHTVGRSRAA